MMLSMGTNVNNSIHYIYKKYGFELNEYATILETSMIAQANCQYDGKNEGLGYYTCLQKLIYIGWYENIAI